MNRSPISQVLVCQGLVWFRDVTLIIGAPVPPLCHPLLQYMVLVVAGTVVEPTLAYTFHLLPQFLVVNGVLGISLSEGC